MRLFLLPLFIIIGVNLLVDYLIYRKISLGTKQYRFAKSFHIATSILLGALIIFIISAPNSFISANATAVSLGIYTYFCFYVPKYVFLLVSLFSKLTNRTKTKHVINVFGEIAAFASFFLMIYSSLITRFEIEKNEVVLEFPNLPDQFDGYRCVQFSDFHLGSLGNDTTFARNVVDFINKQNADVIFFTGDLVSASSAEAAPFVNTLSQLKAKDGVISILGNHDYSDYKKWNNQFEQLEDRKALETYQKNSNWLLLKNSYVKINRSNQSIAIIGVENCGEPPFLTYGNLKESYPNLNDSTFKILLSHNPTHWQKEVIPDTNIDLMLAGHTHAMQLMLNIFGIKLSPSSFFYKQWSGLYNQGAQYLYVNIGVGCIGMPARFGAKPEITVFTLKKK